MSTGKDYDCFWPTGCANSKRCSKAKICIARWQNANKDKLFPDSTKPSTRIKEAPIKTLVREVIAEGRKKEEFKKAVRKHLIKTGKNTREATSMRIKESHKRIDRYWKEILEEKLS